MRLRGVSIPAGFTQCRWSTSREPRAGWNTVTAPSVCPSLPPLPPSIRPTFIRNRTKWSIRWKPLLCLLNLIYLRLLFFHLFPPPPLHPPCGMVICPLRVGESLTCRLAPLIIWHTVAQHGCHRFRRARIRWPDYLPASFHLPHSRVLHWQQITHNQDVTNQMSNLFAACSVHNVSEKYSGQTLESRSLIGNVPEWEILLITPELLWAGKKMLFEILAV